jgi:diguanylate cyclase (GGDEF)-like protein/PAS domain S-box-containing protein
MKVDFRTKLFLFCVLIILSTSIPIAIITYGYTYNSLKNDLLQQSKEKTLEIDKSISNTFNDIKNNVEFLATSNDMEKADGSISALFNIPNIETNKKYSKQIPGLESTIYNNLEAYGKSHPETTYVYIGTEWGGYIQWPDGLDKGNFDPRKRPWYAPAIENPDKVVISEPYVSAIDNSNNVIITASKVVKNELKNIVGVVGIDVSLNNLSEMIKDIKIGDTGYIFLYSKDGTILAHPDKGLNFKHIDKLVDGNVSLKYDIKDYDKLINEENGSFETTINGTDVFVTVFTSPSTGWKLASVVDKSELVNKAKQYQFLITLVTLCILVLGTVFTFFVTNVLTNPIKKLRPLMEAAGKGDFSVRADINTNDEFGEFGSSFNLMIEQLSSSYEELTAVYEELSATEEELRAQYDELQYNEEALRNSEERYKIALESANDSIWEWDLIADEFFVSDKLSDILGYELNRKKNFYKSFEELIYPKDFNKVKNDFENHIINKSEIFNTEFRVRTSQGDYVWVLCKGTALRDEKGNVIKIAGSISDISERKVSEEKIKFMAFYDSLTKLPNKTLFVSKLEEQLEMINNKNVEGAVFFIDLDNFKIINDTMGHTYGDKILIYLAEQFKSVIDIGDTICRVGGDEFIVLNPSITETEVEAYANKLLALFKQNLKIEDKQMNITASIGAALYPKDGTDSTTILKNADSAMYKAKALGKNRFALYDPQIYLKLERKTTIERILRTAIENDELIINYQPQYYAENKEIFGFEALLRLNNKKLGFISPMEFIPIAEECGYITELSLWVLKQACIQSLEWLRMGYNFKSMSINISSVDLQQPDFLEKIIYILKDTGINPQIIELEITETVLMQSLESSICILDKLRDMGIRIALDDFGTGYSSLNYLRKIPINTLKIDKSFIDNISSSKKEESIIENIIEMAHTMDLKVVAEGVEVNDQLLILKDRNCDYIQGYYFSKPLPPNEIEKLFR